GRRGVAPAAGRDRRRRTPAEPRASGLWARVLRLTAQKRPPALSPGPEGARVLPRYAPWIGSGKPLHQSGDPPEKTKEACSHHGVWCNWQHNGFWYRHSRFESWYPSAD